MKNKERIIGISVNGKDKAYSLKKLKKVGKLINDELGGKKLTIHFEKGAETPVFNFLNGKKITTQTMYWFAWYAFHPETEVWK